MQWKCIYLLNLYFRKLQILEYLKRSILVAGGYDGSAAVNDVEVLQGSEGNDCFTSTNLPKRTNGAIYASLCEDNLRSLTKHDLILKLNFLN